MYKKIKQGDYLTITGANLYSGVDTAVYFNSVSESSQAEITSKGFNPEDSSLQILIPGGLPEVNKIIVYNGYGYTTGEYPYRFVGVPIISGFTPSQQQWNQSVVVSGNYFENTTGVFVANEKAIDYDWPSKTRFAFRVPRGLSSGQIKIYTDVGLGVSPDYLNCLTPNMYVNPHPDSQGQVMYGDEIKLKGEALHNVNRIALSGVAGNMYLTNFTSIETTGINFTLPSGVVASSPVTTQYELGYFESGVFVSSIEEESTTLSNLNIVSNYIRGIDKTHEAYGHPVSISGVNLDKGKILFKAYNNKHVESPIVSSGHNYVTVNVPKGIKHGNIVASGTGITRSIEFFYPIPTIKGFSTKSWEMGTDITITGINASDVFSAVGVSGYNLLTSKDEVSFVASSSEAGSDQNEFGTMTLNSTSLLSNSTSGNTIITATINSTMAGTGVPFLISSYEVLGLSSTKNLNKNLSGTYTYKNINQITGKQIVISGKKPIILGIDKPRASMAQPLTISGKYFLQHTGLKLYSTNQTIIVGIEKYNNYNNTEKILVTQTGTATQNAHEQVHSINVNLSDFDAFQDKQGTLSIITPYHGH